MDHQSRSEVANMAAILTCRARTCASRLVLTTTLLGHTLCTTAADDSPGTPFVREVQKRPLFAVPALAGWSYQPFHGDTDYESVEGIAPDPLRQVHARARGTASGCVLDIALDPQTWRYLRWSWQIEQPVSVDDVRVRSGDDFSARVYVVFSGGWAPWRATSLVYVWAESDTPSAFWRNPFTDQAMMMAATRGRASKSWTVVERDLVADYRAAFDRDPPQIIAIAIMTDTDQTGTTASARYGDLEILRTTGSTR